MAEIVPAEDSSHRGLRTPGRPLATSRTVGHVRLPFDSEKVPLTLVQVVRPFLRVANQIEADSPRAAYLCRFHAFERAHTTDPKSNGRGVRQFKTALLKRLQQDEGATKHTRRESSDAKELKYLFYKYDHILKHARVAPSESREQLINAYTISSVLREVLKAVLSGTDAEMLADIEDGIYVPYNILPLDPGGSQQAIMQLPEIKASIAAIRNVCGLPLTEGHRKAGASMDLLDWLQHWFGFQKGNVANQREHLVLLLANLHVRLIPKPASMSKLDDRALSGLMEKMFENYINWCTFVGRKSNIQLPYIKQEEQQYKLLCIGLYLLIWGEASNLRFMPECLCYIFHHMVNELSGMLCGAISLNTGVKVAPAYGGESESFLKNIVTPLYMVIYEEAQKNNKGTADHSTWRNYDDLNESTDCFKLGWPMRLQCDFFCTLSSKPQKSINLQSITNEGHEQKWLGKMNFVEIRSFLQLFRSFDRMWLFFILAYQIIWSTIALGAQLYTGKMMETIYEFTSSNGRLFHVFVRPSICFFLCRQWPDMPLNYLEVSGVYLILDVMFVWRTRRTMSIFQMVRIVLKILVATIWMITLPIYYAKSRKNSVCSADQSWSQFGSRCLPQYMTAVAVYVMANSIEMALFFVPAVRSYMEMSDSRLCSIFSWWAQPRLYVGRGMQECHICLLKYSLFWILLLSCKLLFSYHFEVKPLVESTKQIMQISVSTYEWHELFPGVKNNVGAVLAVWTPITIVYFMDTQIWYSIFCAIFGGVYGIFRHLGEIRTMGMVRSRFLSLPAAFNARLIPPSSKKEKKRNIRSLLEEKFFRVMEVEKDGYIKFIAVWNQIVNSIREEDLISNRENDLMTMPISSDLGSGNIHWPLFLLTTKFSTALNMARDFDGEYWQLDKKVKKDRYMYSAVKECYNLLINFLDLLVVGDLEKRIISAIITEVKNTTNSSTFLSNFRMSELPVLHDKLIQLVEIFLENKHSQYEKLVKLLQDIFEIVTRDMMIYGQRITDLINCSKSLEEGDSCLLSLYEPPLFASKVPKPALNFPLPNSGSVKEQARRLFLLLTVKETAMDIPVNLEARRRISFFATSIFMDMPCAPKIRNMLSFSVMTPYYAEEVNFSEEELHSSQDGASILSYMQKIYPDEWKNFLERMGYKASDCLHDDHFSDQTNEEVRKWASFRGQTLSRTVRGMMYYQKAIKLQAFLDMAKDKDIREGYKTIESEYDRKRSIHSLSAQLDALADMKFTYVISCQMYGSQKASGDPRARDILDLLMSYPSLRVAYIEEKEEIGKDKPQKVYSSVLVKAINNLDQEIYRIKLPGPPIIGEGKPENQNQGIIFTRGDALQTIDMNQDNYMEEAFKMRNVLQEFHRHQQGRHPTILGLGEHIFTGSVSSLAWFMSYQESSFVTIGQRFLANPLRVRFHYGHPDIFDRVFHVTRGGISKASKTINLSEDVFAGFNTTLRCGYVTYHEYMKVGKGRDVGLNQISKFEAKVANGNSEQTLSRDIFRLGRHFDFFRMLSCYFTTVGFYFSSLMSVLGVYIFLYGQLYLVLSGLEKAFINGAQTKNMKSLETALASQSFIQLGLLTGLPMMMEIALEKGSRTALTDFILMQVQLASVFFTFSLGTKSHYFGRTILHGGAKYRTTGRKFVVFHASFTENYRLYSRSHFVKGFELLFLLVVYNIYSRSYERSMAYILVTCSIWFMTITWLFAPFLFNPSGFAWSKIVEDWMDWTKWMNNQGGIGIQQDKSWQSWWNDEQCHLQHSLLSSRILEIILSLRFFIYQYGLVYHLDITQDNKNIVVYVLSWVVISGIFLLVKVVDEGRHRLSTSYHLMFRFFKALLFLGVLAIIAILSVICRLSMMDLIICCLAFIPTGWGLLLIAQAIRSKIENYTIWNSVEALAHAYDYGMGLLLFAPIAALAWMPVISAIQTRVLFNQAFTRQLQIQPILAPKSKRR